MSIKFSSWSVCYISWSPELFSTLDFLWLLVLLKVELFFPRANFLTKVLNSGLCRISSDKSLFSGSVLIIILRISYSKSEICYLEYFFFLRLLAFLFFFSKASTFYPWKYVFLVALNIKWKITIQSKLILSYKCLCIDWLRYLFLRHQKVQGLCTLGFPPIF